MAEKYIVAIDQGTTNAKAGVVNLRGDLLATSAHAIPLLHLPDGGVEQDPAAVWDAVKSVVKDAVAESGASPEEIVGLIAISQYSSIIPVDKNGDAVMNMVTHMDGRGTVKQMRQYNGYRKDGPLDQLRWLRLSGLPPLDSGMDSLSHMRFIKYAFPEVYEKTSTFLEPTDFLTFKFTGRATANQCTTLMMLGIDNRSTLATSYHPKLIERSGIDPAKWPELVPVDSVVGTVLPEVAEELGLSPNTQVITGANDTQAGGIATHSFEGDHGALSIGTTGVLITHMNRKRTDIRNSLLSMPSPFADKYFVMAENGMAGKVVEYFLEKLIYPDDALADHSSDETFAALDEVLARVPAGSNGVMFLPWLAGASAPVMEEWMRGGILNVSLDTTREDLAKAAVEGVTLNLQWLRTAVERFTKRPFSHIYFYGGGARSSEWTQMMADVFRLPMHRVADPEYTVVRGGAFLGFERLGLLSVADFASLLPIQEIVEPRPGESRVYAEAYEHFLSAFKHTRRYYKAIH